MKILVINSGSSSIKYQLFDAKDFIVLATGLLEQIGEETSRLKHHWQNDTGDQKEYDQQKPIADHQEGFAWIVAVNFETGTVQEPGELIGIGHRVVHGGELFHEPTLIENKVLEAIREVASLAPLHNQANLIGIEVAMQQRPDVPQVAVFDTAYHHSMPPHSFLYALPYDLYKKCHIRRYGFHGTSHQYVAEQAAAHLGRPLVDLNLIILHLGNGASAAAIKAGKSVDTSMGLTPLEGLVMGTRCGDLDPAIPFHLTREAGLSLEEVEKLLNKQSGLKGICGINDMREIILLAESGDRQAQLAIDLYCYRIKKYIGAYFAVLGHVDVLIFTGGIGENAALIRQRSCENLNGLGIILDEQKNASCGSTLMEVQDARSKINILVVPTNEELAIARQTLQCIRSQTMEGSKMLDCSNFAVEERLKNGRQVLIRAIRPDDKGAILSGFANLSGHSRQMRFFGFKSDISDQELQYYTEVDNIHHVALVVIVNDDGNERIIGGGRYMEYDISGLEGQAEVAFAVADEFQGVGLATLLFKHLVHIARQNGIKKFKAEVLRENSSMLKVFEHSGLPMQRSVDAGVVDVTLDIE